VRTAALLAAALLLAAAGCGNKGAVLAPELVRPEPPTDLAASATPEGVRLTWTRPTRYTGGQRMRDLGSFVIERADADASPPTFTRVGTLVLEDQTRFRQERRLTYTDTDATPDREYVYRVTARTLDGYVSRAAGPVKVRFTRPPG
jgi:predicted small lipoprotein YifL